METSEDQGSISLAMLLEAFDERQMKLIDNCLKYASDNPGGLPGHNLMVIISLLVHLLYFSNGEKFETKLNKVEILRQK